MKKFLIGACAILVAVIAVIISLACVKPKYQLNYSSASSVTVFEKSVTAKKKNNIDNFEKDSAVYAEVMKLIDESLSCSLLKLLYNQKNPKMIVEQDLSSSAVSFTNSLKQANYCIELTFDTPQNQIVYYEGDAKLVTANGYYGLMFVLGSEKNFRDINIFFKTTSYGAYQNNPMKITIDNSKLIDYIISM